MSELLRRYISEVEQDLKIDDFNIKSVQMRMPARKHYWVGRMIDAKVKLNNLNKDRKAAKEKMILQVMQQSPVTLSTAAAEKEVDKTAQIQKLTDEIYEYTIIVEYLEKVEKILSATHWEIKNIIDINRAETI